MRAVIKSFDVIGDIAIIEVPEGMDAKKAAKEILEANNGIKVVCKKTSERKGAYRTRDLEVIGGEKRTTTTHVEYGCAFMLDVSKAYFSPRELSERQRIANLAKDGEDVLVMFSGIGALPVIIAKKKNVKIVGIELNKIAHGYAEDNVRINRVGHKVSLVCGDVKKVCPQLKKEKMSFDRILMPLPKDAENFLDAAIPLLKKNGTIHLYQISDEDGIKGIAERLKKDWKAKIANIEQVLPYSPRKFKYCIDFTVNSKN